MRKIKNSQPETRFTGSYKKKECMLYYSKYFLGYCDLPLVKIFESF